MAKAKKHGHKKMLLFNPENWMKGNVTPTPPHVTTFQADAKGFETKYMPGMKHFSESCELFRKLTSK